MLLGTDRIVQDRSSQMLLQHTLICEACYKCAVRDGSIQTIEGWWIFNAEYTKGPELTSIPEDLLWPARHRKRQNSH